MIIHCVSDLHGYYPDLEGGDLLLLAGDYTKTDTITEWAKFFSWLKKQNYRKKILVAGNHDNFLSTNFPKDEQEAMKFDAIIENEEGEPSDFEYLCDYGTEFEGLKIWGSPWTRKFEGENPNCLAFTCSQEKDLDKKWELIPKDTDILITHGPAFGMMDTVIWEKENVGSVSLAQCVETLTKLKAHIFGHIHECSGIKTIKDTTFVNASYVNHQYRPLKIIREINSIG